MNFTDNIFALLPFTNGSLLLNLTKLSLDIKQLLNVFITIIGHDSRNQILWREIFHVFLLFIHDGVELFTLAYNAFLHHHVNGITTVYFYFFKVIEQTTDGKVGRACKGSDAITIPELARFCVTDSFLVSWLDDTYVNTFVIDEECQTLKELLLVFIECFP